MRVRVKARLRVMTGRLCGDVLKSAPERVLKSAPERVHGRVRHLRVCVRECGSVLKSAWERVRIRVRARERVCLRVHGRVRLRVRGGAWECMRERVGARENNTRESVLKGVRGRDWESA